MTRRAEDPPELGRRSWLKATTAAVVGGCGAGWGSLLRRSGNSVLSAAETSEPDPHTTTGEDSALGPLITQFVRANLPEKYENLKEWGTKKRVWDGIKWEFDQGRLETRRRWKDVNHGSWKMYQAWPITPEQELTVELKNLRALRPGCAAVELLCRARIGAFARWSEWRHGVQLFSVHADAEARVRLALSLEATSRLDLASFPPGVVLEPKATAADLYLEDFRLLSVSDLRGSAAKELGDALEGVLRREVAGQSDKLVTKINQRIEKSQDKLKFAPSLWPF